YPKEAVEKIPVFYLTLTVLTFLILGSSVGNRTAPLSFQFVLAKKAGLYILYSVRRVFLKQPVQGSVQGWPAYSERLFGRASIISRLYCFCG
ncbi:MAG: hypothetical protein ACLUYS_03405, partial [Allobaculum sp.]|uniref:hypothetical protein n=1 Tax=Allobaculum sp. TaxID=1872463 RepID=UPI00399ADAC6